MPSNKILEVNMDAKLKKELQKTACKVRMGVIEGTYNAKSGHPGGSLYFIQALPNLTFFDAERSTSLVL